MNNIKKHNYQTSVGDRRKLNGHNSFLIWFTGLSGSGKSTIANALEIELFSKGVKTYSLDGDNIRHGLNKDLGFSPKERTENIRRIAEVANLMIDAGIVVIAAFVSPYRKDRESIKNIVKDVNFVEVYVNTSLEECERRDVKGLYKKARAGEIKNMTGITALYEKPLNPDIEINTELQTVHESVLKILDYIKPKFKLENYEF
jgi:adenylylsulfate kinase